jgi:hypothetical protein
MRCKLCNRLLGIGLICVCLSGIEAADQPHYEKEIEPPRSSFIQQPRNVDSGSVRFFPTVVQSAFVKRHPVFMNVSVTSPSLRRN